MLPTRGFSLEQGSGGPWGGAGGAAGAAEPQAGSVLGVHPCICPRGLGKPHLALGISWEGRNSTELLGGFLPRKGAGSMGLAENTPGASERARETVLSVGVCCWVIKMSPSHSSARSVPPPGATISECSLHVPPSALMLKAAHEQGMRHEPVLGLSHGPELCVQLHHNPCRARELCVCCDRSWG